MKKILWSVCGLLTVLLCVSVPAKAAQFSTTQSKTEYCNITTSGSTVTFSGKVDDSTSDVNDGKYTIIQYQKNADGVLVGSGKPQNLAISNGYFKVTEDITKLFSDATSGYYSLVIDMQENHKSYEVYFSYNNNKLTVYKSDALETDKTGYKFLKKVSKQYTTLASYMNTVTSSASNLSLTQTQYNDIKDQATSVASGYVGNYNRAKAIYQWVTQNIYYNQDVIGTNSIGNNNTYNVFKKRYGVCEGYARLLVDMLTSQGIPSVYCTGLASETPITSKTGSTHGWVAIFAEGRWFFCDPTWDSANVYTKGRFITKDASLTYFDMSLETASMTHRLMTMETKGTVSGFEVVFVDGNISVLAYQKNKAVITLPEKFKGLKITGISCSRFSRDFNRKVKRIIIPKTYTTISNYGFQHFPNLKKLYVPKSVVNIGTNLLPHTSSKTYIYCTKKSAMYKYAKNRYLKTRVVSKVTMTSTVRKLKKGKSFIFKAKLNRGGKAEDIIWSSSNKKIATVSATGKVKAKKAGKVYITATVIGSNVKRVVKLQVKK